MCIDRSSITVAENLIISLHYCRTNWYHRCSLQPGRRKAFYTARACTTEGASLSLEALGFAQLLESLPALGHFPLGSLPRSRSFVTNWKKAASEREARGSWKWLWETDGGRLFCSACSSGNVCQVEILLEGSSSRPADAFSNALVHAASSGHLLILGRLIRENADIDA